MKIKQLLSSVGVSLVISLAGTSAHAGEITVASWGGSFQAAQSKAIFQPVAKAMGITINEESYKGIGQVRTKVAAGAVPRSEEHTSELQSRTNLVCRLLLEKKKQTKKKKQKKTTTTPTKNECTPKRSH